MFLVVESKCICVLKPSYKIHLLYIDLGKLDRDGLIDITIDLPDSPSSPRISFQPALSSPTWLWRAVHPDDGPQVTSV